MGGPVDNLKLSLRIYGEDLIPEEVSATLGCRPTNSWRKGDPLPSGPRVRRQSAWFLDAPEKKKGEIDEQIQWLLSRLTPDVRVWKKLNAKFKIDLNAVIYMVNWNRGFEISPASMAAISRLGLKVGFDIYYYGDEEPNHSTEPTSPAGTSAAEHPPRQP